MTYLFIGFASDVTEAVPVYIASFPDSNKLLILSISSAVGFPSSAYIMTTELIGINTLQDCYVY